MKKFITALGLLILILIGSCLHSFKVTDLTKRIRLRSEEALSASQREDWAGAAELLERIRSEWDGSRVWVCATVPTSEIEEIEISLRQSLEYAKAEDASGFTGEFTMFRCLMEHLPSHEGFDLKEIL